jgi:hypothetical protein
MWCVFVLVPELNENLPETEDNPLIFCGKQILVHIDTEIYRYRGLLPQGKSGWGVKLTAHLHLVPRLRMYGAIPLLPQYVFMVWYLVKHRGNYL